MALSPLVSAEDFTTAFPRDLDDGETARLDYLLTAASNAIRSFCRRDFTATSSTIRVKPIGDKAILPNPPITSITSVKRVNGDGTLTGFAGWAWDGGVTLYGMGATNSPMVNAPESWNDDGYVPLVEVTYSHGDADIPPIVTDVVIAMVARVLNQPGGDAAVDGVTTVSDTTGPLSHSTGFGQNVLPGIVPRLAMSDKRILREAGLAARTNRTVQLA